MPGRVLPTIMERMRLLIQEGRRDIFLRMPNSLSRVESYVRPFMEFYSPHKSGEPSVLVIAPTRDIAEEISGIFALHKKPKSTLVTAIGGSDRTVNVTALSRGCDFIVGTPARLQWLFTSGNLVTKSLKMVVLDDADLLLTSPVVVDFVYRAIPKDSQRILCMSKASDSWLNDTLSDITTTPALVEQAEDPIRPVANGDTYSVVSASEELVQLSYILRMHANEKGVVICRSNAQVSMLASNPQFPGLIAVTMEMSPSVRCAQTELFSKRRKSAVAIVSQFSQIPAKVSFVVRFGLEGIHEHNTCKTYSLIRSSETAIAKQLQLKSLPIALADQLAIEFACSQIDPFDDAKADETASALLKTHGAPFLAGLLQIAHKRRESLFERKSPLSGLPGYGPVLLLDPFSKKIKSADIAHKLVCECLPKTSQIGRIALSEKGFVLDVPNSDIPTLVNKSSKKLRNIPAIFLQTLPRLVTNEKLFLLKQAKRDKTLHTMKKNAR